MNNLYKTQDTGSSLFTQAVIARDVSDRNRKNKRSNNMTPFIVTLGGTDITEFDMNSIVELGLKILRFKMSVVTEADKVKLVEQLQTAVRWYCEKYNVSTWPIALSTDLPNACVRTGFLENRKDNLNGLMLKENSTVLLTSNIKYLWKCNENLIFLDDPLIMSCLTPGSEITLQFGAVVLTSVEKIDEENIKCKVDVGGAINDQAFVCTRGIDHMIVPLTDNDLSIIEFARAHQFDIITINTVRCPSTVKTVRALTASFKPLLISAVSEQEGLDCIDDIIKVSDGIILSRDFLVHEIRDRYKMITIQLHVTGKCRKYGKPLYLSGEILESTLYTGKTTDCDINDISNAVFQKSSLVLRLFNDPVNLVKGLRTINGVCEKIEPLTRSDDDFMRISMEYKMPATAAQAAVLAAVFVAKMTRSLLIIVPTVTGRTVKQVAHIASDNIILAITSSPIVAKQLQLHRGVIGIIYDKKPLKRWQEETEARVKFAVEYALKFEVLHHGESYVVLRKGSLSSSYCDHVSVCAARSEEDIVRLTYLRKKKWDVTSLQSMQTL